MSINSMKYRKTLLNEENVEILKSRISSSMKYEISLSFALEL